MTYKNVEKYREARLRWYYKNKEKVRAYRNKARRELAKYVSEIKNIACSDCKIHYLPYVMDFEHIDSRNSGTIGIMAANLIG